MSNLIIINLLIENQIKHYVTYKTIMRGLDCIGYDACAAVPRRSTIYHNMPALGHSYHETSAIYHVVLNNIQSPWHKQDT